MEKSKVALVTGASGQDSLLLSEHLLGLGYDIWAMGRRCARPQSRYVKNLWEKYPQNYHLIQGDVTDISSIIECIELSQPTEFYNLAAQSHVGESFKEPISTFNITGGGVLNCLEAIRRVKPDIRFYQASSSEMYGGTVGHKKESHLMLSGDTFSKLINADDLNKYHINIITENTPFAPRSPYACAKLYGHTITQNYREAYGLHASCGILFNHESELRKLEFVTRKVTSYVAQHIYKGGNVAKLKLGCLDFARDWGDAKDYVKAMHLMLQQAQPNDYIVATSQIHTGKELLEAAFGFAGLDWTQSVEVDKTFSRPSDVKVLVGDATKAKTVLGWEPTRPFKQLIHDMVGNDLAIISKYGEIVE